MQIDDIYTIPEWARAVVEYLNEGRLLNNKKEARRIRMQLARYTLIGEILYRRGYMLPLLKCLSTAEAEYALKDIQEGVCGSHFEGWMLSHKVVRAGYYWTSMDQDSVEIVQRCNKCQRFAKVQTNPQWNSARFCHHGHLLNGGSTL